MKADQTVAEPAGRLSVRGRRVRVLVGSVLALGVLASATVPPDALPLPVCRFKEATGVSCLTCGLTRSLHATATGDFTDAVHFHLMGPVMFAAFILLAPLLLIESVSGKPFLSDHARRAVKAGALVIVAAWVMFGVVRGVLEILITRSS